MNKSKIWKWPHPHLPEILQSPEFYRKCDKGMIITCQVPLRKMKKLQFNIYRYPTCLVVNINCPCNPARQLEHLHAICHNTILYLNTNLLKEYNPMYYVSMLRLRFQYSLREMFDKQNFSFQYLSLHSYTLHLSHRNIRQLIKWQNLVFTQKSLYHTSVVLTSLLRLYY